MGTSIQSRLAITLTATAIALSVATGILLHQFIGAEMVRNFDRGLQSNGRALISLVSFEPGGVLDFEFNEAAMPQYRPGPQSEYFQIWFADGRAYAQSESLRNSGLVLEKPTLNQQESLYDFKLPNGRLGRAIRISFIPQSAQPQSVKAETMVAIVARDRVDLDQSLRQLLQSLMAAGSLLVAGTALTSLLIVRRTLRPLRQLAEQAAKIDATNLSARLTHDGLPSELVPISERLNDLLYRLEMAFLRERCFSSDIAHELRTPIAELRSIAEVALAWPDDNEATLGAVEESLAIAVQMQTLVNTLLALARTHGGHPRIALQPVNLADFINESINRLDGRSKNRSIKCSIACSISVLAEPTLLRSVLLNLLTNAAEYAHGDDPVQCTAMQVDGQLKLVIENVVDTLSAADLPEMFDPFWRKSASRTNNSHAGLGLSLVRAYCGLMGAEVTATMPSSGKLQISISFSIPALQEQPEMALQSSAPGGRSK